MVLSLLLSFFVFFVGAGFPVNLPADLSADISADLPRVVVADLEAAEGTSLDCDFEDLENILATGGFWRWIGSVGFVSFSLFSKWLMDMIMKCIGGCVAFFLYGT